MNAMAAWPASCVATSLRSRSSSVIVLLAKPCPYRLANDRRNRDAVRVRDALELIGNRGLLQVSRSDE
jgi:hypothetical protein